MSQAIAGNSRILSANPTPSKLAKTAAAVDPWPPLTNYAAWLAAGAEDADERASFKRMPGRECPDPREGPRRRARRIRGPLATAGASLRKGGVMMSAPDLCPSYQLGYLTQAVKSALFRAATPTKPRAVSVKRLLSCTASPATNSSGARNERPTTASSISTFQKATAPNAWT
jgi:hypothetical protein